MVFDPAADSYEKIRLGYQDELYDALKSYCFLGSESRAVEVGIGGSRATLPVLRTGCYVTVVENKNESRIQSLSRCPVISVCF